jgi:ATP-dependent RNA helicase SUPV3L1/SUV3
MRGLKEKDELSAEIADDGAVHVEKHFVGRLQGFRFFPDTQAEGIHGRATRNAAAHVLSRELAMRARRVAAAKSDAFKLTRSAQILWREEEIARLAASDDPLKPAVVLTADEHLAAPDKEKVKERLVAWIAEIVGERLKPLVEIAAAKDISGLARGIAFRLSENFGALRREAVAEEMRALDQPARAQLRGYGVRFGAFNIYFPVLLKPASAELALVLWTLKNGAAHGLDISALPEPPRPGLTSLIADKGIPEAFYRVLGFHVCGPRAVRIDMLERLADQIRPLVAWRADPANPTPPPKGATGDGGFRAIPEMMSILGCSAGELGNVLQALGFRLDRVRVAPATAGTATASTGATEEPTQSEAHASAPEGGPPASEGPASEPSALPPEPDSPAAAEPSAVMSPAAPTAEPGPAEETKWDEIWRPRRHGRRPQRHPRGPHARHRASGEQAHPSKPKRSGRHDKRERHPGGRATRMDNRPRPLVQSASPPKTAGPEADSPFAALHALKLALEKPSQT